MAAQELRWLTYLLTDLGEVPRSPPVLYVDNKVMLALCQEHRLEHRTKHIALRYFLARELQQCGQLRLAYVASQANTADVFTKALQPCDHQRQPAQGDLAAPPTWLHWVVSYTYLVEPPAASLRPVVFSAHRHFAAAVLHPRVRQRLDFATAETEALALVKSELQKGHTCTDLGELRNYLGLQITRDRARRTITPTQSHMVHQVLQRLGFWYSSPQSTPPVTRS
ncbi:unnamed protein product [Closterium sp. NIES-53]